MNFLLVGADKTPLLEVELSRDVLIVDDGPLIDSLEIPARRKVTRFDISKHHLNPLHQMDYRRAREFVAVMDAVFPEGENTLTKKNSNFVLLNALLDKPTYLHQLIEEPDKKDAARVDAYQKIATLMLSPVLSAVLCKPTNFSLKGIVLAKLDRAKLGDFDAFVLANLLISQFQGTIILPDGGFYLRDHHISLIRQERLVAGLTTLAGVHSDRLRQELLTIEEKVGSKATFADADELANYSGFAKRQTGHTDSIGTAMGR